MYLCLACVAVVRHLNWSIVIRVSVAILHGENLVYFQSWMEVLNLRLLCCFVQFKKLTEPSTAIFDSSINILVVFWFKATWNISETKGSTLA